MPAAPYNASSGPASSQDAPRDRALPEFTSERIAEEYARRLLADVGSGATFLGPVEQKHPLDDWAASGAMALTGEPGRAPSSRPCVIAACTRGAGAALEAVAKQTGLNAPLPHHEAPALLGERAATHGLGRRGQTAAGGRARLIQTASGWVAVNLARDEDIELLGAWLESPMPVPDTHRANTNGDHGESAEIPRALWDALADNIRERDASKLVGRARLMGLPVAPAGPAFGPAARPWLQIERGRHPPQGPKTRSPSERPPRVVDLSGLWAGPLAAALLAEAGADVIKVECSRRLDGARRGPAPFFDLMNGAKRSFVLDFASPGDLKLLKQLLASADIVIESSRPRALKQLGIDARNFVDDGVTWLSITGYGRGEPEGGWVAFGDDAAAAGGLSFAAAGANRAPIFCADAIADPLAGLHAALAALAGFAHGGNMLLDIALEATCRNVLPWLTRMAPEVEVDVDVDVDVVHESDPLLQANAQNGKTAWRAVLGDRSFSVAPPRARSANTSACSAGANNAEIDKPWGSGC